MRALQRACAQPLQGAAALRAPPRGAGASGARGRRRGDAAPAAAPGAGTSAAGPAAAGPAAAGPAAAAPAAAAAAPAAAPGQALDPDVLMPELAAFLEADLPHLFDDVGIDASRYDDRVEFVDPITRYSSLRGYLFNIAALRRVFAPRFTLLGVRRTGAWELTTRWAMAMRLSLGGANPLRLLGLDTRLAFTGTSVMTVNPATGKFCRHVDTWDAISNQAFFSAEAFAHVLAQVADLKRTPPELASPPAEPLLKRARYEVRRYAPHWAAAAPLGGAPGGAGGAAAFQALAAFIFGANAGGVKMAMTTPVLSESAGRMLFYVGDAPADAPPPAPARPGVELVRVPGGVFAAAAFGGVATAEAAAREAAALRAALAADGLAPRDESWALAQYNDPFTPPPFRRNEVLVELEGFELPW